MNDFDTIIVGAGPAGCAAAWDLCSRGRSVLLLDRHEFPRCKACAGGLTIKTLNALRYPVSPIVQQVCDRMRITLRHARPASLSCQSALVAMVVREEFDAFCLDKTIEAGAEFRTIDRLLAIRECDEQVMVQTTASTLTSRFLIGADGADSRVRKLSGQFHTDAFALAVECQIPRERSDAPGMDFDFHVAPRGYGWVFPKRDHWNVGVASLRVRAGNRLKQHLQDYIDQKFPDHQASHVIGHRVGIGGRDYRPTSPRIFLVGDAAGTCEPMLAEGIHNAIVSGQAAAAAIDAELSASGSAQEEFTQRMQPIWRDLRICHRGSRFFYRYPKLGYGIFARPAFHRPLIQGFADGKTVSTIGAMGRLLSM